MAWLLSPGRDAAYPKLIIKSSNAVPALLLRDGSNRYVVPLLSLEQQLMDDVAVEVHALRQRRDDVVVKPGPGWDSGGTLLLPRPATPAPDGGSDGVWSE